MGKNIRSQDKGENTQVAEKSFFERISPAWSKFQDPGKKQLADWLHMNFVFYSLNCNFFTNKNKFGK